jgi:hypothetical protein
MDKLNIVYDLLQKTKLSSNTANSERQYLDDHQNDKIQQRGRQVYFAICNSCYWCASYFDIDIIDCHVCNSHTKLIPISTDGSLRIELAN